MIYTGQITRIERALDSAPLFTVVNASGVVMFPCYMISSLGGTASTFGAAPLTTGANVMLVRADGNAPFYIIGGIATVADQKAVQLNGETASGDYTAHALDETVIRNANSTLTLSPRNNAVLNAPSIKLQLQGASLRVSQQDVSSNAVLNAQPFIDTLFEYLNEIVTRIGVIERMLQNVYFNQAGKVEVPEGLPEDTVPITPGDAVALQVTLETLKRQLQTNGLQFPEELQRRLDILKGVNDLDEEVEGSLPADAETLNESLRQASVVQELAVTTINDHITIP